MMELPEDICRVIHEFARPLTRGDWRKGSYIQRNYATCEPYDVFDVVTYTIKTHFQDDLFEMCHIITNIMNKVAHEYYNYITDMIGFMILDHKPSQSEIQDVFLDFIVTDYIYEQHGDVYFMRSDFING
jgi:hypothetical protein